METKTEHDELMKVAAAANYLKVSKALVYQLIAKKQIPHIRLSKRRVVIRRRDLELWLEARAVNAH